MNKLEPINLLLSRIQFSCEKEAKPLKKQTHKDENNWNNNYKKAGSSVTWIVRFKDITSHIKKGSLVQSLPVTNYSSAWAATECQKKQIETLIWTIFILAPLLCFSQKQTLQIIWRNHKNLLLPDSYDFRNLGLLLLSTPMTIIISFFSRGLKRPSKILMWIIKKMSVLYVKLGSYLKFWCFSKKVVRAPPPHFQLRNS